MAGASLKRIWWGLIVALLFFAQQTYADTATLEVKGAVRKSLSFTVSDLKNMSQLYVHGVVRVEEKADWNDPEKESGTNRYEGVLLRDILDKAGMKFVRKWEPGVLIRVKGAENREAVFSFGEIFYSSTGRSILVALKKDNEAVNTEGGIGELVVATDVRAGRYINGVREILVERVDIPMIAYNDKKKNIIRPPTSSFIIIDHRTGKTKALNYEDLAALSQVNLRNALMAGDCEGFNGIYGYGGPLLRSVLEWFGLTWADRDYGRYVVVSSEDGFCATFSLGELFNSRLDNNIIIAHKKNGAFLEPKGGFATSVVGEDSMGGRSVKRIHKIEIY